MRLIDAVALSSDLIKRQYSAQSMGILYTGYPHMMAIVSKQQTIDAVPVVRCKDCSHTFICNCLSCRQGVSYYCGKYGKHMMPTDFCSYGERKGGEPPDG